MDARQEYRAALSTCPPERLLAAHARALAGLSASERAVVLAAVRIVLLTGTRSTADDVDALGRFIASAELRRPGSLLDHVPDDLAARLRRYVVIALPLVGLRVRPRTWAALDVPPEPARASGWEDLLSQPLDPGTIYTGVISSAVQRRGSGHRR